MPALIGLLGGGGAPAQHWAEGTGFHRRADREQFLVVYPDAMDGRWNDGRGQVCALGLRAAPPADDVGLIARWVDVLTTRAEPLTSQLWLVWRAGFR